MVTRFGSHLETELIVSTAQNLGKAIAMIWVAAEPIFLAGIIMRALQKFSKNSLSPSG
ncbi:MAG: hypothetical protein ACI9EH_000179 [Planktomarina sp.]|jgi:hypothetical protein|tara:strand:- start:2032 stop:2205 length:174 start_codon:yes stop_codon:yes gene_type:complete